MTRWGSGCPLCSFAGTRTSSVSELPTQAQPGEQLIDLQYFFFFPSSRSGDG